VQHGIKENRNIWTEEELADVVNEIVNGSDSDTDNIPEF
jgi:hypothetical protein